MKLPNAITSRAARQILQLQKHSPTLMFGAGVVGAVAATVLACKATLRLDEVLEKHETVRQNAEQALSLGVEYDQKDYDHDMRISRVQTIRNVAVLYAPAAGAGLVSLGLLTGAHVTLNKRNAALGAAYAALDKGFREYRARVREEMGEDKDREFLFGAVEKEVVEEGQYGHEVKNVKRASGAHSVYAKPFDETNRRFSRSAIDNQMFLTSMQNYMNDLLQSRGHVFLNDVYDALGMDRTQAASIVGWVKDSEVGDNYVDFGLFNSADPVVREFMNLEHNDGIMIDFNVDGVVYDLIGKKY